MKLLITLTILAIAVAIGLYRSAVILNYFHPSPDSADTGSGSPVTAGGGCPVTKLLQHYAKKWYLPISWLKWLNIDLTQDDMEESLTVDLPTCLKQPFSIEQLEKHKHLSLLGQVYDITTFPEMYGKNGGYNYLTGIDATRHFANNGEEAPNIKPGDDMWVKGYALDGLSTFQLEELIQWMSFFNAKYNCVGYIVGPYYDPMGEAKPYLKQLKDAWEKGRKDARELKKRFPKCNSFAERGSSFFSCSPIKLKSGEEVKGVPRNMIIPTSYSPICVCIPVTMEDLPYMLPYAKCPPHSARCELNKENHDLDWSKISRKVPVKL